MVELRNGKQLLNTTGHDTSSRKSSASGKRDVESNLANKENNVNPAAAETGDAQAEVDKSKAKHAPGSNNATPDVKRKPIANKKRRRNSDEQPDESEAATTELVQNFVSSNEHQDPEGKPLKRTRKALEIEWDRSQLRDPRLTPERVILPRREEFDLTEEEEQFFKGPAANRPANKKRGFSQDEFRKEAKKNVSHCFHELYVCHEKGPNGSPTYDSAGFQLDYDKVAQWMKPKAYNKRAMVNGMEKELKREAIEEDRMVKAFFEGGKTPEGGMGIQGEDLLKDKVSKDLGIAFHKVTAAKVEEWATQGFPKADPRDYLPSTVTKEEQKRFRSLHSGSDLRK